MPRFLIFFVLMSISCLTNGNEKLRIDGFATLALTHIDDSDVKFRASLTNTGRSSTSFLPDSVIGVQAQYSFNDKFEAVIQGSFTDKSYQHLSTYINMAFLRYRVNNAWSVRAGRLNTKLYMLSEYRDANYAYLWARPPIEMYGAATSSSKVDGVEVTFADDVQGGHITASLAYGYTPVRMDGQSGEFKLDFTEALFLSLEQQFLYWRFSLSAATGVMDNYEFPNFDSFIANLNAIPTEFFPQGKIIADYFDPENKRANYLSVGAAFDDGEWIFQTELAFYRANWSSLADAKFGYISLGKHIQSFTPYIMLAFNEPEEDYEIYPLPDVSQLPPPLNFAIPALLNTTNNSTVNTAIDQTSIGLGLRWDMAEKWCLKVQVNRYKIDFPGSGLFGNNAILGQTQSRTTNVYHLSVSTVF
ncbi:hypothetical protein [Glaciecola sp. 1036]|uniref:hypothetical protein n=1 Tax=Alteromonadaceae TaxID=72275 RepID=UPI003CFC3F98